MNFKVLLTNLLGVWPALHTWKAMRAEAKWGETNGTFERCVVVIPIPRTDGRQSALACEVGRPIEWTWTLAEDGAPTWPDQYTVLDARVTGRMIVKGLGEAMQRAADDQARLEADDEAVSANGRAAKPEPATAVVMAPAEYQRPELTAGDQMKARLLAVRLVAANKSTRDLRLVMVALVCENAQLTREVNEHRSARGLVPLATFEAK